MAGATAPDTAPDPEPATAEAGDFAERPEIYVGAAFAGGLVLAQVLRWLGK